MKAYSEDLRRKIVEAVEERGMPKGEAAKTFGVGVSSVKRYAAAAREGRTLAPKKPPGSRPKLDEEAARRLLEADLDERPAATLPHRREFLRRACGVWVSDSTVSRVLRRLGWSRKKKRTPGARERDEFVGGAWRALVARVIRSERRFVFVDEMGANTSLLPLYAWSRKGERARTRRRPGIGGLTSPCLRAWAPPGDGPVPGGRRPDDEGGLRGLPGALPGALAASGAGGGDGQPLRPQGRQGARDRRGRGMRAVVPAPPYSPDLNPIEEAFAKIKGLLRREGRGAYPRGAGVEAMGRALDSVTSEDARGFFGHRGYRAEAQLL